MTDFDPQPGREMPPEPELTTAQSEADEQDLADGLQGLAGLIAGVQQIEDVLAQVAGFATAAIPGAHGAGVTLMHSADEMPKVLAWSVTAPFVREVDQVQYDVCKEGPCLSAMQTRRTVVSGSLGSDTRWPRFGGRVARLGVHSALSLPLVVVDQIVGAINVYARERDAFTEHALRLGEQFAGPAAVSVHNTQVLAVARAQAQQLQSALVSRATIDQAIGILRSRSGATAEEAFERLRQISQSENVKLAVIAQRLVEEAVRRAQARHTQSSPLAPRTQ